MSATERTETLPRAQMQGPMHGQGSNPIDRLLFEHPRDVGESYVEHFGHAAGYGLRVLKIAGMCFVHALVPAWFKTAASSRICAMADELDDRAQAAREERCRQSGSYDPGL